MGHPSEMKTVTKAWGRTRCVHKDQTHEVWHAEIEQGGYSSRHYHERAPNLFYVVSGVLRVLVFGGEVSTIPVETITLNAGERITIRPGVWHKFEAVTAVELVELYWAELRTPDIVRADEGGVTP